MGMYRVRVYRGILWGKKAVSGVEWRFDGYVWSSCSHC